MNETTATPTTSATGAAIGSRVQAVVRNDPPDPMFRIPFCMHGNYLRGPQCPECAAMAAEDDAVANDLSEGSNEG